MLPSDVWISTMARWMGWRGFQFRSIGLPHFAFANHRQGRESPPGHFYAMVCPEIRKEGRTLFFQTILDFGYVCRWMSRGNDSSRRVLYFAVWHNCMQHRYHLPAFFFFLKSGNLVLHSYSQVKTHQGHLDPISPWWNLMILLVSSCFQPKSI